MAEGNNSKTTMAWAITSFTVVIASLGAGGYFGTKHQEQMSETQNKHQKEIIALLDTHQKERLDVSIAFQIERAAFQKERIERLEAIQKERFFELDKLLQTEINDLEELVMEKFRLVGKESEERHDQQQELIQEIKSWFKPPKLRTDGSILNGK